MRSRADSPLTPARDRTTAPKEPLVAGNALPPQTTATLMLALQRMAGNQAVASLLTSGTNRPDLPVLIQRAPPASAPPRPRTRRKPPAASKPARGQKFDAFAEKSYDLKTTDGVLRFAADLHTELLHEYLDLPARTDGQVKLLAGRALFIYTEYYLPRLRASAGSTTPDLLMKATVKAVADARQEAGDEAVAATRISAADYRSLFPLTTARQYDDEATRLRAIPVDPVLEQYKLQAATDEKREDFIFWGRAQYADRSTADLFEAEAKRIRQGQRKGLGFSDDKVFFPLKGRETAEAPHNGRSLIARPRAPSSC